MTGLFLNIFECNFEKGYFDLQYLREAAQRACQALGSGWRVPSDDDWKELLLFYGGYSDTWGFTVDIIGDPDKSGKTLVKGGSSGFDALCIGGLRYNDGKFNHINTSGNYWSSTEEDKDHFSAKGYNVICISDGGSFQRSGRNKKCAYSCRCVQN